MNKILSCCLRMAITLFIVGNAFSSDRIRVAVLDSGLDLYDPRFTDVLCPYGHKDFTGEGIRDVIGHGTHVAGIIANNAPDHSKYCLVILKVVKRDGNTGGLQYNALEYLATHRATYANMSLYGQSSDELEKSLLSSTKADIVVAAGNDNVHYKTEFPGGYNLPNIHVVGNWDCKRNKKYDNSNYGEGIIWRCGTNIRSTLPHGKTGLMTGTSMAAPLYTAELINQRTKGRK